MDIALLVYDGVTPLDAVGPFDVLGKLPKARIWTVGLEKVQVHSRGGALTLRADHTLVEAAMPDIVIVPGGAGADDLAHDPLIRGWLQKVVPNCRHCLAVSTGSLILGGAGLLQGKEATTHWRALDLLAGFGALVKPVHMVTSANITTAAGAAAGIDAALSIAAKVAGEDVARAIQQLIGYDPAPPFASGDLFKAPEARKSLARTGLSRP
ncbi:DJ-1/PfpI family protein [Rhodospirillum sp. A1_3_36]|uniref:DJ-1/PfpI family protein n=1 Tax=Rhodospirillum sp. A1_3_36 TaxID=3391666 RepID=UPI0039A408D4